MICFRELALKIVVKTKFHLGIMDISVKRNAYGSQQDSFNLTAAIPVIAHENIPLVFIRAPWIVTAREECKNFSKNRQ
ncbi:MAG: hypothetical protein A2096_03905 [Spirochaetes bacterium GWF1_41_5]|nr:MAG: hypothetical protein A2096_03905 [Spirochaetes bacterium GWF1_41_5]